MPPPSEKRIEGPAPGPLTHPVFAGLGKQPSDTYAPTCTPQLLWATPGNAGLDLCASTDTFLKPEGGVKILPTGVIGPPPPDMIFLILGRASSTISGLIVHPSLVDNDYTGEIKILASSKSGTIYIPRGRRIAQALPLPVDTRQSSFTRHWGDSQPGSSDLYWVQTVSRERPTLRLKLEDRWFDGILDTGADSTVTARSSRPLSWPLQPSYTSTRNWTI